jgi:hypothetical protein
MRRRNPLQKRHVALPVFPTASVSADIATPGVTGPGFHSASLGPRSSWATDTINPDPSRSRMYAAAR